MSRLAELKTYQITGDNDNGESLDLTIRAYKPEGAIALWLHYYEIEPDDAYGCAELVEWNPSGSNIRLWVEKYGDAAGPLWWGDGNPAGNEMIALGWLREWSAK